jgi:hypothetical protein
LAQISTDRRPAWTADQSTAATIAAATSKAAEPDDIARRLGAA